MSRAGLRRVVHGLRTEGAGRARDTAAVALGVFIGCQPLYGLHFLICWATGWLLGLNRLKLYLAANISNPLVAPILLFAELQTGSWLRRGEWHPLTLDAIRESGVVGLGADLLLGSLLVGTTLAIAAGLATFAMSRDADRDPWFAELVRRTADRYVSSSVTAWEFARGKLTHDPIYRAALCEGLLLAVAPIAEPTRHPDIPDAETSDRGRVLADIGCGQGLMLALLAEAGRPGAAALPSALRFARMVGVETRPRVAAMARAALGDEAEIFEADARTADLPAADVVLLFDVLHLMGGADQETLVQALVDRLAPGGVILIREADGGAGWRFRVVRLGNRLKAIAVGRPRQTFHFRTADGWRDLLSRHGLDAEAREMGQGTPFGNVLFKAWARGAQRAARNSGLVETPGSGTTHRR